ncbi:tripartite tricarboxylate transporter substrate binding protein [Variovorax sp. LjRoot84]|uniref:Bug family tripartite tricarboxylate transporter substrate binding protein n=1 Tax=unclassified Variovorax TaxID=663243 RepID=UPI003ECCB870
MNIFGIAASLVLMAAASAPVFAQSWPAKPVTVIVPYVAGGGVDPVARLVSQKLADRWKQPVLVDNRAGASGTIGANVVAKAIPDGTTILMSATAEVVINQHFMKKMAYDPERDLKPVTLLVKLPFALVTEPSKRYKDMAGLLNYARQNPGMVSYASSGPGTPQHLAGVLVEQLAGVSLLHVPFRGVAQAMTDLMGGQVEIGFAGLPTALQQVRAGKLRALGVSSKAAAAAAPQIPPIAQTPGLEKFELIQWFGVFVPAKTPDAVVQQIQRDISEVLAMPEVRDTLSKQGADPSGMPTAEFESFVKSEREKFRKVVQAAKIEQ